MDKCYVGIDIGTTNIKAIALQTNGIVGMTLKKTTPFYSKYGATFFNMSLLEKIVNSFVCCIQDKYRVLAISFSSVGESVVPVANGQALADPLFWNDPITKEIESQISLANFKCNPELCNKKEIDISLSLCKIIWMQEKLDFESPDYWLPISSYFIYYFTGIAKWDYTQATRTLLMDIDSKKWDLQSLEYFRLENLFDPILTMGTYIEEHNGITYSLGGHDHIVGLFYLQHMMKDESFIFDSLGSSESLVTLTKSRDNYSNDDICIGVFDLNNFYTLNYTINSGTFLEFIARITGNIDINSFFELINNQIVKLENIPKNIFSILVGGDPILKKNKFNVSFINMPLDSDTMSLIHSCYIYLCTVSKINLDIICKYTESGSNIIIGGNSTINNLYMLYKSIIFETPAYIVENNSEISAMGAALCAAVSMNDTQTIDACRYNYKPKAILPDFKWADAIRYQSQELISIYNDMQKNTVINFCS